MYVYNLFVEPWAPVHPSSCLATHCSTICLPETGTAAEHTHSPISALRFCIRTHLLQSLIHKSLSRPSIHLTNKQRADNSAYTCDLDGARNLLKRRTPHRQTTSSILEARIYTVGLCRVHYGCQRRPWCPWGVRSGPAAHRTIFGRNSCLHALIAHTLGYERLCSQCILKLERLERSSLM
jgi:hypothetical protein